MKNMLIIVLVISSIYMFTGCSTTSEVTPYIQKSSLSSAMQQGVVYSLPKSIFEVKITYSLYSDTYTDAQGNLLKSTPKRVVIEKPIEISTKTIPDKSAKFVFDTESLNGFTKDTNITLDLTSDGMLKATNMDVKDKTKEIVANVTGTIFNATKAVVGVKGAPMRTLDKGVTVVKDVTVVRMIDPSTMHFRKSGSKFIAKYNDTEKSERLFNGLPIPKVVVTLVSPTDIKKISRIDASSLKTEDGNYRPLKGFPYRTGSSVEVIVKVNNLEVYDSYHLTAQGGGLALIPINAKTFSDITQTLSFGDNGYSLVKFTSKEKSQGEKMSLTTNDTTNAISTGLTDIENAKLNKL